MSTWQYKLDGQRHGPVSFHELGEMLRSGKLQQGTQVCRLGGTDWRPAWHVPGLMRAAGIAEKGDSPAQHSGFGGQGPEKGPESKSKPTEESESRESATREKSVRSHFIAPSPRMFGSVAVGLLTMAFFYHQACQATRAFPLAPKLINGVDANCYFPVIGRCTRLECSLAYLDVFIVAVLATSIAIGNRLIGTRSAATSDGHMRT